MFGQLALIYIGCWKRGGPPPIPLRGKGVERSLKSFSPNTFYFLGIKAWDRNSTREFHQLSQIKGHPEYTEGTNHNMGPPESWTEGPCLQRVMPNRAGDPTATWELTEERYLGQQQCGSRKVSSIIRTVGEWLPWEIRSNAYQGTGDPRTQGRHWSIFSIHTGKQ